MQLADDFYSSYEKKDTNRASHVFPVLATGSGMGKTRFGWEVRRYVDDFLAKRSLPPCCYIYLNYNGGGHPIGRWEMELTPERAIALRIASEELFHLSPRDLYEKLSGVKELSFFTLDNVFSVIAGSQRRKNRTDKTITILLHFDEYQLAHTKCLAYHRETFVKDMIYALGGYRMKVRDIESQDSTDKVLLLPLLTGTTLDGVSSLSLSDFGLAPLSLLPLPLSRALKLLEKELESSPLLENRQFHCFVQDLGVVPRYLEWLVDIIKSLDQRYWSKISANDVGEAIIAFSAPLLSRYNFGIDTLIDALGGVQSPDAHLLLRLCLSSESVSWNSEIHGKTLEALGQIGNLFLASHPTRSDETVLYFPGLLLDLYSRRYPPPLVDPSCSFVVSG